MHENRAYERGDVYVVDVFALAYLYYFISSLLNIQAIALRDCHVYILVNRVIPFSTEFIHSITDTRTYCG